MSNLRRLARDHHTLLTSPPADYLLPPNPPAALTHLSIYLLGPSSTPYFSGVFLLTLTIPPTYPSSPPTANFITKIFHPNVCERTGDVCVDTLKKDWNPKLTLRDVLVTIRCLLVCPNGDSALNEEAARLMQEGFGRFEERARVWTEVHARCPEEIRVVVEEMKKRDEGGESTTAEIAENRSQVSASQATTVTTHVSETFLAPTSSQPSQPPAVSTPTPRKQKKSTSTTSTTTSFTNQEQADSDLESGKENLNIALAPSPAGSTKRSRSDSALDDHNEERDRDDDADEVPQLSQSHSPESQKVHRAASSTSVQKETRDEGRKSPKLRKGDTPAAKVKATVRKTTAAAAATTQVGGTARDTAGKRAKPGKVKVGLKRF